MSIFDLTEQQKLIWYSPDDDVKMCVVKGKDEVSLGHDAAADVALSDVSIELRKASSNILHLSNTHKIHSNCM